MKKIFVLMIALLMAGAIVAGYISWKLYLVKPPANAQTVMFEIKDNESAKEIAASLHQQKLLDNPRLFMWYLNKNGLNQKIESGLFELRSNLSIKKLSGMITNVENAEVRLTFIEGWTLEDYDKYLQQKMAKPSGFLYEFTGLPPALGSSTSSPRFDLSKKYTILIDKPASLSLEGYLFPDTYRVHKNATADEIAGKMLVNFGKKMTPELRFEIDRQGKPLFAAVTMASLIEAETKTDKDRRLISDILWRRLDIGMPLQLDSTVNYVTGNKKPAISAAEQTIESPYNTYKYKGLPLGPINNPGMSSILAAIYPEKNDYWFFLSGSDGKMYYAKTLAEHNQNKREHLER